MSLDDFTRETVATGLGAVQLWTKLAATDLQPVVVAITGALTDSGDVVRLIESLGFFASAALLPMPMAPGAPPAAATALSKLVGQAIEARFPARPVVLLAIAGGAAVALGVRAKALARVVAVKPTPFNDTEPGLVDLATPLDVVLGARADSRVDAAARRRLAETPGVRLHRFEGAGHDVVGEAIQDLRQVLLEACRRAAVRMSAARLQLDEPLLEATPLTAGRLLHWGRQGEAFAAAYGSLNPGCEVVALGEDQQAAAPAGGAPFDALVLASQPPADLLARLTPSLKPLGHVIARWTPRADDLAPLGLALRDPIDDGGTGVVRAQKLADGRALRPALTVKMLAFAPTLMDIRTRLPARGLGSDPDLRVTYDLPPMALPALAVDTPKVLVMQRCAELSPDFWRPLLVSLIRGGWLAVAEYDDYPPLVNELHGRETTALDMQRFGFTHAVQTATPRLAELFAPYNPEIALFPNAAFDVTPFPQGPRPPRVFYGAVLRGRYAVEVAAALGPAIARQPETEFVVIGDRDVFDAIPTRNKQFYDYMSFEAYLELLSQCTISLSPIEALPYRDTKSDAKFLDAARAGVLTIASPTIYDRVIRHGENGLLARDVADWAVQLGDALSGDARREQMARRAWDDVRAGRMFAHQVAARRDWYFDLWARREALNAALVTRVPGLREALAAAA